MKIRTNRFFKYWVPVLSWAIIIFVNSSISLPPELKIEIPFFDKAIHLFTYTILGYLLLRALLNYQYNLSRRQLLFMSVLIGTLYGISDEFHQYFVPGRIACVWDAVFDFFGSIVGVFIYNYGGYKAI